MTPLLAQIDTGSVIVAVALLALVGVIMVVAMVRFPHMEDILKLWGGLGTLVGLIVGTMGTYFFTKEAADKSIAKVEAEKNTLIAEKNAASELKAAAEKALLAAQDTTKDLKSQIVKLESRPASEGFVLAPTGYQSWSTLAHVSLPHTWMPQNDPFDSAIGSELSDEHEREAFAKAIGSAVLAPVAERNKLLSRLIDASRQKTPAERATSLETIQNDLAAIAKKPNESKENKSATTPK